MARAPITPVTPIQSSFIFLLYFLLRVAGFPVLVLYFVYRGLRDSRYFAHFAERWGTLPPSFKRTAPGSVWLHAVSVGEVVSGARLIRELRETNPAVPIYLSTTTVAGRAVAQRTATGVADGVFYAPVDYGFAVRRVLRTIRPAVVVVLETEIWPVLYREAKRAGCGLIVCNGRISDRALPRYRRFRWAFAPVLALPDTIFVQSETDRRRYLEVGAPEANVKVAGNLKYDAAPVRAEPPAFVTGLLEKLRPSAVWIAASTMPSLNSTDVDEDDAVIAAFRELAASNPGLLLILAPRKPERFSAAADKLRDAGVLFVRRSQLSLPARLPCALLLDSLGELASLFPTADVVFMGGTLARRGGHNVLEPASCGKPIVAGPRMENFAEIAAEFDARDAWLRIEKADQLAAAVAHLLRYPEVGARAAELTRNHTGVAARTASEILKAQDEALPHWDRGGLARPLLWPLSRIWISRGRRAGTARALDTPVISVGGIAMGGTGKTPFVQWLSQRLHAAGYQSAILTRGYRRRSSGEWVIKAGSELSAWHTGDEAQLFVRSGVAHVGIGADRWAMGRRLEQSLHPDVFLLDDGFQHRRLRRDLDIVLIDALNPFPGGVFPLGRMREPLEALGRADLFVISRAQPGREYAGIRAALRRVNPNAPVFLASVEAHRPTLHGPVAAFCGLGNPDTFWRTLREQGVDPVFAKTFRDHRRYTPRDLRRLRDEAASRGAKILLTTEKDAMNLPENAGALVAPLQIHTLKIQIAVQNEADLVAIVIARIDAK